MPWGLNCHLLDGFWRVTSLIESSNMTIFVIRSTEYSLSTRTKKIIRIFLSFCMPNSTKTQCYGQAQVAKVMLAHYHSIPVITD